MKYTHITTLFIFFSAFGLLKAQNTLQYNLEQGTIFKVKQDAKQLITQKVEGSNHEITNDITGLYDFKIDKVDENGYDIILIFQNFTLKTNSSIQGELMNVDATELVEGDIMSEMFHALIGHELNMRMNSNGSIVSVKGGDKLISKMIASAGIEDESVIATMRNSLKNEFGSESLAKSFEQMTFFYPDTKVAVGDTWENKYTGKLSSNNTFKLEKIADNTTAITGTSAIVINSDESGTEMSLSGSQESAIQANKDTGFIQKIMISSTASGVTKIAQLGGAEIPTTIESRITYELLEK